MRHARAVRAEVNRIGINLEGAIQRYDGAQVQLRQTKAALKDNTQKLRLARANFRAAQQQLRERVFSLYMTGKPTALEVLAGATSITQVINRTEAAQTMSQRDTQLGREALHFEHVVQKRQNNLKELRAKRAHAVLTLAAKKREINAALARQQRLLASIHSSIQTLRKQEAAREARLKREAEARLAAEKAREAQQASNSGYQGPPILNTGAGHPEAASVALQYVGVPYVWGGESPSGFDCSGLVQYSYAQIGISIPRTTYTQWPATEPISQSQALPGDLVFFNGLEHVGIYLGGGMMVDAPHTGAYVRVESIYGFGTIDGFRRVP
jgi:cell wall-associated NlpC family hydrolase